MTPDAPTPSTAWLGHVAVATVVRATIWATVDLEATLGRLGLARSLAGDAVSDGLLGARVVLVPDDPPKPPIALAEPTTEGRLAARLARHDEGPAGHYLGVPLDAAELSREAAAAGVTLSVPAAGPLGLGRLVLGGRLGDALLILVAGEPVPSPP